MKKYTKVLAISVVAFTLALSVPALAASTKSKDSGFPTSTVLTILSGIVAGRYFSSRNKNKKE